MPAADIEAPGRVRLIEAGAGPPVVLIHGALTTLDDWRLGPLEVLAARFRTIALDRPGHGGSPRPRFEAAPERQAGRLREALGELGVERPVVVGHSFGGLVALAWAAAWAEEIAGLVLLSPMAFREFRPAEHLVLGPRSYPFFGPALSEAANATVDPPMLPRMQDLMFSPQAVPDRWRREFPHDLALAGMVADAEDSAVLLPGSPFSLIDHAAVTCPTRVLYGSADRVVDPNRHAVPLAARLPHASTRRLEGLGHMLHHFAPDAVVEAVDDVLASGRPRL
ncbi:MAG TPA: alpha/beta hydrolase [Caulobacteraceae bacterium]|nr:alpha/beta hydrolase [Caulobacteraceae bacterium]